MLHLEIGVRHVQAGRGACPVRAIVLDAVEPDCRAQAGELTSALADLSFGLFQSHLEPHASGVLPAHSPFVSQRIE